MRVNFVVSTIDQKKFRIQIGGFAKPKWSGNNQNPPLFGKVILLNTATKVHIYSVPGGKFFLPSFTPTYTVAFQQTQQIHEIIPPSPFLFVGRIFEDLSSVLFNPLRGNTSTRRCFVFPQKGEKVVG